MKIARVLLFLPTTNREMQLIVQTNICCRIMLLPEPTFAIEKNMYDEFIIQTLFCHNSINILVD